MADEVSQLSAFRTQDGRVPGILARLERLESDRGVVAGVARQANGIAEGLIGRVEDLDLRVERVEQSPPVAATTREAEEDPRVAELQEYVATLEGRLNTLARALLRAVPGAAAALKEVTEQDAKGATGGR